MANLLKCNMTPSDRAYQMLECNADPCSWGESEILESLRELCILPSCGSYKHLLNTLFNTHHLSAGFCWPRQVLLQLKVLTSCSLNSARHVINPAETRIKRATAYRAVRWSCCPRNLTSTKLCPLPTPLPRWFGYLSYFCPLFCLNLRNVVLGKRTQKARTSD